MQVTTKNIIDAVKHAFMSKKGDNVISGHITYTDGNTYDIGTAGRPLRAIYATNLYGYSTGNTDEMVKTRAGGVAGYLEGKLSFDANFDYSISDTVISIGLTSHIANASAHHAPVTVGNTGLSLSAQQISLNLASSSGLEISSGLKILFGTNPGLEISTGLVAKVVSPISKSASGIGLTLATDPGLEDSSGLRVKVVSPISRSASGIGLTLNATGAIEDSTGLRVKLRDTTLVRDSSGLGIKLDNANTWSARQTFSGHVTLSQIDASSTGVSVMTKNDANPSGFQIYKQDGTTAWLSLQPNSKLLALGTRLEVNAQSATAAMKVRQWVDNNNNDRHLYWYDKFGELVWDWSYDHKHVMRNTMFLMTGSLIAPVGYNRLLGAHNRYSITYGGTAPAPNASAQAAMFDGIVGGTGWGIGAGLTGSIEIDFQNTKAWTPDTATGYTYPAGKLYFSFYYTNVPSGIKVEFYRSSGGVDSWVTTHDISNIPQNTTNGYYVIDVSGSFNWLKKIRFTFTAAAGYATSVGDIWYVTPAEVYPHDFIYLYARQGLGEVQWGRLVNYKTGGWSAAAWDLNPSVASGASNIAYRWDTLNSLSAGKIVSWRNADAERAYLDHSGTLWLANDLSVTDDVAIGDDLDVTGDAIIRAITYTNTIQAVSGGAGNLTLSPVTNLILDPGGLIEHPNAQESRTTSFSDLVTGITGFRMWDAGSNQRWLVGYGAKFDELHVRVFVADETRVDRGAEYWSKSYGIVETSFVTPANQYPTAGNEVDVWFEDAAGVGTANLFTVNDWLLLRSINWSTGLVVFLQWYQVVSKVDDGAAADGTTRQQWKLRRMHGGSGGVTIKKGTVMLDVGQSGQGWIHLSALTGDGGPFIQAGDWSGSDPYTGGNFKPRVRMGHLSGFGGLGTGIYGFAAAKDGSVSIGSGYEGFAIDATNGARFYNTSIALYSSSVQKVNIDKDGINVWIGISSADKRLSWDGSLLTITGAINVTSASTGISQFLDRDDSDRISENWRGLSTEADLWSRWTDITTHGAGSFGTGGTLGGRVLICGDNSGNDQYRIRSRMIPFDPNRLYRIRARIRRAAGSGYTDIGVMGFAADGSTLVDVNGNNTGNFGRIVAKDEQQTGTTDWTDFVGYLRGTGATGTDVERPDPTNPAVVHTSTVYIAVEMNINKFGAAGIWEVNFVEMVPADSGDVTTADGAIGLRMDPNVNWGANPGAGLSGLLLGADYLGYWNGSAWKSYMDNSGRFYLNSGGANNFLSWNGTTLTVNGTINIQGGDAAKIDFSNITATLDALGDGSTYKRTTANEKTGAGRAYSAINSSNVLITSVIPGAATSPSGNGLYLTSAYMGYYYNSAWRTYLDNSGNFYINNGGATHYLAYNGSTLTVSGAIVVRSGSSGIGTFSDAGALATASSASWTTQVSNRPTELTDGRISTAINASGVIQSKVDPGTTWGANPGGGVAGLLLGSDYMGYWDGAAWKSYMDNAGRFYLNNGVTNNFLSYDGSVLTVGGIINVAATSLGMSNFLDGINQRQRFTETFEDATTTTVLLKWGSYNGTGEMSIGSSGGSMGGRYLSIGNNSGNDQRWLISTENIPYDTSRLYRIRARVRRTAGSGTVYIGLAGVADDGTTFVNATGANGSSSQHYVAASGAGPGSSWTEYVGYVKGTGSTGSSTAKANPNDPGLMHTNTKYIRALILVNYNAAAGTTDIDYIDVAPADANDVYNASIKAGSSGAPNGSGLWLGPTEMGYYNGSSWTTRIDNSGNLYLKSSTGARLEFNASDNELRGYDSGGTKQWYADGDTGLLYAGAGSIRLSSAGLKMYNSTTNTIFFDTTGDAFFGTNVTAAATTVLAVFASSQSFGGETMGAGDVLIGDKSAGHILWDESAGQLKFRNGTNVSAYVGTDGKIYFGDGSGLLDVSGLAMQSGGSTGETVSSLSWYKTVATRTTKLGYVQLWQDSINGYNYIDISALYADSKTGIVTIGGFGAASAQDFITIGGGNIHLFSSGGATSVIIGSNVLQLYDTRISSDDANSYHLLGRAFVGYDGSNNDHAAFGHRDHRSSVSYALRQNNNGDVFVNAASGRAGYLRINNIDSLAWTSSLVNIYLPTTISGKLSLSNTDNAAHLRVEDDWTPASAGATGSKGDITWDANYLYICVAASTWKRVALSTW